MQHFRGQDSILTNGYPPEVDRVYRQKFLHQVTFSSPISRSALLVVDWMRTIIKRKKKKCLSSAALRRFASRADEPESNATGCLCWADSLRVTQVFAWEAVVGAGFRQPVVYQPGTTRGYQAGAPRPDNFSIIRRRLALSVWIPLPKSNVTCVITTQSRVQLISVCDEERVDIFPRSLISGKKQLK